MTADLFDIVGEAGPSREAMADGAVLLRGFAKPIEHDLVAALQAITAQAPFRHMFTPGGHQMSVAMTNCGNAGWVTDRNGYRYDGVDPVSGQPWPAMPQVFLDLAERAAAEAGFGKFSPDACLINRYEPGTRLSLHQDKDERDFAQPIVSVRRVEARRQTAPVSAGAWRHRGVGRTVATVLSRRGAAGRWRARADRPSAHQPDFSQGAVVRCFTSPRNDGDYGFAG